MKFLLMSTFWVMALLPKLTHGDSDFLELSIEELQEHLNSGKTSSVELVKWYQARIAAYDQQGPTLNAIQHINERALEQANQLDVERKTKGPRSPLHGIPILIKDNYETVDAPTTAGSAIFKGHWPKKDATQVVRLKKLARLFSPKPQCMNLLSDGLRAVRHSG